MLLACFFELNTQAALVAGDFAFTSFNADEDGWSIATFVDKSPNKQIYFSNNAWFTDYFNFGEAFYAWSTGSSVISARSVIRFTKIDASSLASSIGSLQRVIETRPNKSSSNYGLNQTGENLYAYLGANVYTPTTFLTAI